MGAWLSHRLRSVRSPVAGQSIASVVVDHFGWVGFEPKPVSAGRLAGMALVGAGVVLVRIF
jgi:bacterial/archaeal transporter family-2 protein